MNRAVQKYGPPIAVLGAALYLGWPPSRPMDLGENVVRAKSVRWKVSDLATPDSPVLSRDPFNDQTEKPTNEVVVVASKGPSEVQVLATVQLNGIMRLGGNISAVVNGKAYRVGETIEIGDDAVDRCTLVAINERSVVVQCNETVVEVNPRRLTQKSQDADERQEKGNGPLSTGIPATPDMPFQNNI